MKIKIPENTLTFGEGATCLQPLCSMQLYLDIAARIIKDKYKDIYPIHDLLAFEMGSWARVITNIRSFVTLCVIGEDYNSCCTLARSIADSICALKLIYQSKDLDETLFRHYLYVLDGLCERLKLLKENITNDGKITEEEFEALKKQLEAAKKNSENGIDECNIRLKAHPYNKSYPQFAALAIQGTRKPWKFNGVGKISKGKIVEYTWKEMYSKLDYRKTIIGMYSNYLSQFVHGLAISCIPAIDDEDNLDSIASIGVCLQGLIKDRIDYLIGPENIKKRVTLEDVAYLLSLYSSDKAEKIIDGLKDIIKDRTSQ